MNHVPFHACCLTLFCALLFERWKKAHEEANQQAYQDKAYETYYNRKPPASLET